MPRLKLPGIRPSEITAERFFHMRRDLLAAALGLAASSVLPGRAPAATNAAAALRYTRNPRYSVTEKTNTFEEVTGYNNFYEFGLDKGDPAANASTLRTKPWSVTVAGEAAVTGTFTLEDILKPHPLEERIYRHRCVEAWSMVIPWVGFSLADLLARFKPTSRAKFVEFTTLLDPRQMPGQRRTVLDWPYVEALRIDEAMHPLTLVALGAYGQMLPKGLGAPIAIRVPWKFGTKSPKAVVRLRLSEKQPATVWNTRYPKFHSFWGNINPAGATNLFGRGQQERKAGDLFKRATPLYNGYAEQVAGLYQGMNPNEMY
jgi:methionine sulfoxide reductase catalytic subunit